MESKSKFYNKDPLRTIKIENLELHITNEDLRRLFECYGEIEDCKVWNYDRSDIKVSRRIANIKFFDALDAEKAVICENGTFYEGKNISVTMDKWDKLSNKNK